MSGINLRSDGVLANSEPAWRRRGYHSPLAVWSQESSSYWEAGKRNNKILVRRGLQKALQPFFVRSKVYSPGVNKGQFFPKHEVFFARRARWGKPGNGNRYLMTWSSNSDHQVSAKVNGLSSRRHQAKKRSPLRELIFVYSLLQCGDRKKIRELSFSSEDAPMI